MDGRGPLRAAVVEELAARGISSRPIAGCPAVDARIGSSSVGLLVTITDAYGRTSERTANGPAAAATLIESWVRTDLSAPLLPTRAVASTRMRQVEEKDEPSLAMPMPPADAGSNISLAASAETSLATDGSLWLGVTVGLCLRVGPACAGVLVRVSNDGGTFGESHEMRTGRFGTDVLLGAGLPIRRGRLTLIPGAAVGVGWLRTSALSPTVDVGGDGVDVDGGGLRASASLRLSIAVTHTLAADFGIAADLSPVAHTAPFNADSTPLAGEPRGFFRGGVGVRWGVP